MYGTVANKRKMVMNKAKRFLEASQSSGKKLKLLKD